MILMLNTSYKGAKSNTQSFFETLAKELDASMDIQMLYAKQIFRGNEETFSERLEVFAEKLLKMSDVLVIGAPLYVDGLPAQAVKLMEELLEHYKGKFPNLKVYVISNLGFYESSQIQYLFGMVKNWCIRMGITYGGGLAIGAGPMATALKGVAIEEWSNKQIQEGLSKLAKAIQQKEVMEDCYCQSNVPRWGYKMAAHLNFGKIAKKNGLTVKDVK